ncbi:hypothetical protein [Marinobacter sp. bablab_jr008]|uniref:hypothetical protein n=1 Tax=Marinobacter sp. bablab_jr008 TaxID=2755064 RepID=UPI0018F1C830|nr:hypothetical protein [Marinobacter sp. bablab_jr008]
MSIPGISTGGGSLQNQNSSAAESGDILGGSKSFSFAGPNVVKGLDTQQLAIWAAVGVAAFLIYKGVKRG